HNIATLNFEDLCCLIDLQIQNFEENIVLGGASLLNLPDQTTTTQITCSEYSSYINNQAEKQFTKAIASTQLKTCLPFLTEHHCISHHLALASKDAAKQTPYFEIYDETVQQLYSYFSRSYSQLHSLQMIQNSLDKPNLDILQAMHLKVGQKTAQQLYNDIDQDFLIATHFLADILSQLHCLSLIFQADYVSVSKVTIQVNAVIESITIDFISEANIQPTFGTILLRYMN
ncbi:4193_t:CDS:2, partial [Dentiscutata erythropus]